MTAWSRMVHEIYCNGRIPYPVPDGPDHKIGCMKTYQPPEDKARRQLAPAALRKLAAADGWTHVRSKYSRRLDQDFCPEHKPEPEGSQQS